MIEDWFSYGTFSFTASHNYWAILNWAWFEKGEWPSMPDEFMTDEYDKVQRKWIKVLRSKGTYIEEPLTKRLIKAEGSFVKPAIIKAEIVRRLKRTGIDGRMLIKDIQLGLSMDELEPESKDSLKFISGWRYKRMPYSQWKKQQKYRRGYGNKMR